MKGGLWLVRFLLLVSVSAVVLSPLVVYGVDAAPEPFDWRYDTSELMLPSSPAYPVVTVSRDVRMSFAECSFDRAELSLSFANQDAADIVALVERRLFVEAVNHSGTFKTNFDHCLGWMKLASQRGTDVSLLLEHVKNDHLGQQMALGAAAGQLPSWATEGVASAREQVTNDLLNTIETLQGREFAQEYVRLLNSVDSSLGCSLQGGNSAQTAESQQSQEQGFEEEVVAPLVDASGDAESRDSFSVQAFSAPLEIISLSVKPDDPSIGEQCTVACEVDAANSDNLSFSWWCSNGDISADGSEAEWTLPDEEGNYEIEVMVTDNLGQGDSMSLRLKVEDREVEDPASSSFPDELEIVAVTATAEHKYLEPSLVGYSILVSRSCDIECEVADSNGVEYEWVATAGEIEGSGNTITWSAPGSPTNCSVTVTISDGNGNEESMTVAMHVTTCSQCF